MTAAIIKDNNLRVSPIFNIKQETLIDDLDEYTECSDYTDNIIKIFDKHLTILAQSNRGKGICIKTINRIREQLLTKRQQPEPSSSSTEENKIKYTIKDNSYRTKL